MNLTPTEVYYQLTQYMYLATSGDIRKANIFAVKHTWFYYNDKDALNKLMLEAARTYLAQSTYPITEG